MTHDVLLPRAAHAADRFARLRDELAPLLARVAEGALRRELDGELPVEPVRWLKEAGFGALRVPASYGGRGLTLPELTQLWVDLAAADANLAQALRGHFALVEDRLWQHARGADQQVWFERFAAGEIAGNAWSEPPGVAMGLPATALRPEAGGTGYVLDGTKCYTTGTIYAEWVDVHARLEMAGAAYDVIALVDARAAGVTVVDDWDGFGQRGTGSGTTTFEGVRVPRGHVAPFAERFTYQAAFYQLNLLATLVGIGRAALADTVALVRGRERNFSHANAARVRDDAQVLARIGEIAAAVYAAEAATLRVADALQLVAEAARCDEATVARLGEAAEIACASAQVVVAELVLRATSDLFDTLGASATVRSKGMDRHWRNARTVATHNPRILKARVVGDHLVNGTPPPYAWSTGATVRAGGDGQRPAVSGIA